MTSSTSAALKLALCTTVFALSGMAAMADETGGTQVRPASATLSYGSDNDRYRIELAPGYSEELGWSMRGAAGAYLTDAMALGLIVEYGENKREYLGNAGIQFTDALSLVGTIGMLEEDLKFDGQPERTNVQQMEYGASLKGAYEIGFLSGFELDGYLTNADTDNLEIETGKLYGVQLLAGLDLTSTTHVKLGGGYEWLRWDDGDENDSFAFSAEAVQQIGDMMSVSGNVKLGASEYVYGGGLALDLSQGGPNTNRLGLDYSYIDGRNGVEDDQRVALSWSLGFGAGPVTQVAAADITDGSGRIHAVADVATVAPANTLLSDVMRRPAYLPQQVIARSKGFKETGACTHDDYLKDPDSFEFEEVGVWYVYSGPQMNGPYTIDLDSNQPLGIGKFDLFVSSNNHPPPEGLKPFRAGVTLAEGVNSTPWDVGDIDPYGQAFWAFVDDGGQCKAIYWGED